MGAAGGDYFSPLESAGLRQAPRTMPRKSSPATPPEPSVEPSHDVVAALAGSIAHDFSNLLMVIRNATGFLREELEPEDPRQQRVDDLMHAADRARHLTEQLQAIGQRQILRPDLVVPADMVHELADTFRHIVPEDVQFRITVRTRGSAVKFDPAQLPIVVMRLLSYAAEQARGESHLLLLVDEKELDEKKAESMKVPPGKYVRIVVTDTARSVDADAKTFAPRMAGRHTPRGTDLRLASVYAVVRQSGGFVESTAAKGGHGLSLCVWLPVVPKPAETARRSRRLKAVKEVTGSEVVLVVEDDDAVRHTVRDALERYGYTVLVASDGNEALRLMQLLSQPPDLLLTDLVMPEVTGRELIESLTVEGRLPKVLMMSGYTDDEVLRRAGPSEAYPFIRKPFTHQELAAKVRETLEAEPPVS